MVTTNKDYYEILGVARDASDAAIKKAYRKLARRHHPDLNKGDAAAEAKFKEVAEAFAVLSDSEKRAKYDRGGHDAFGPGFDPFAGFDASRFDVGVGDLGSIFSELFGGAAQQRGGARFGGRGGRYAGAMKGRDVRFELSIGFRQAVTGGEIEVALPAPDGSGSRRRSRIRIPAGIDDGGTLRLAGRGAPGAGGGPAGDAYVTLRIQSDPMFRRDGRDLLVDVPVGVVRATLGGAIEVPTLDGSSTINLPPGTRSSQKLRLKGKGVPAAPGRAAGDLFAVIRIHPPTELDERSRELFEELARHDPRA